MNPIDFTIGQNDTLPVWTYQIIGPSGVPANLTGLTVELIVGTSGSTLFRIPASVTNAAHGNVSVTFTTQDTATSGTFEAWFVATDGAGNSEHFPNDRSLILQITPTLV